jgi:hypothetical protein
MIFAKKKKILVWCDDPQEDPVISVFAGCLVTTTTLIAPSQPRITPLYRPR